MIPAARSRTPAPTPGLLAAAPLHPRSGREPAAAGVLPLALLAGSLLLAGAGSAAAGEELFAPPGVGEPLTLRISDAVAPPGGLAAIVLRTYSSRPVGQGQLDFAANCRLAAPVKDTPRREGSLLCAAAGAGLAPYFVGHLVFSSNGDVQSIVDLPPGDPDAMLLRFLSPSGSVNDLDGPLAALFFRLPADAVPGTVIDLALDAAGTVLIDDDGDPVAIDIEPGFLLVRAHGAPRLVAADGDKIDPGETAELALETFEPFALAGGHVVLRYDPSIAAGPPAVRFDRRYGRAAFTADVATPGTIVVDFEAPDGSLNRVPGGFIQIALPVSAAAPRGTRTPFTIDRAETWLAPYGIVGELPLQFVDGEIEIRE
jgi:hypothetical protein